MPANFLHGVETIRIEVGPRSVRLVKAAVSACVGTAPTGPVNKPTLVLSDKDAARFGPYLSGFTIADALNANFVQGRPHAGAVIVVNVLDPAVHRTQVTGESLTFGAADNRARLAHPGVMDLVVKSADGATTYVLGADYTVDAVTGALTRVGTGAIPSGATVDAGYFHADPTKVTAADIIGAVDGITGKRTGLQSLKDCHQLFGFFPKRVIAPGYSPLSFVSTGLIAIAERIRARAYIDAPVGITPAETIAGRGPAGTINFNTSSLRARLCYPHVEVYDAEADGTRLAPLSQYAAGVGNASDLERGYWWSSSNREIRGIVGLERDLSAAINDPASEVNLLNEVGITTVFNAFGTGHRLWGNRSAAWPTDTSPYNFENVLAVGDIVDESIEHASLQYMDMPIDDPWIDAVTEMVNGFLRKLKGDGAILDGRCWYDPDDNPETEVAMGHVAFRRGYMSPLSAERITNLVYLDLDYLKALGTK